MLKSLKALWMDDDGPTTVEYALLLVLVCLVAIGAWTLLGGNVRDAAQSAADTMPVAVQ
jgi:pilus assembly protein Flp/PilA